MRRRSGRRRSKGRGSRGRKRGGGGGRGRGRNTRGSRALTKRSKRRSRDVRYSGKLWSTLIAKALSPFGRGKPPSVRASATTNVKKPRGQNYVNSADKHINKILGKINDEALTSSVQTNTNSLIIKCNLIVNFITSNLSNEEFIKKLHELKPDLIMINAFVDEQKITELITSIDQIITSELQLEQTTPAAIGGGVFTNSGLTTRKSTRI